MTRLNAVYDAASDAPARIAKTKLRQLSEPHGWNTPDICRAVARFEARRGESDLQPLVEALETTLRQWRLD